MIKYYTSDGQVYYETEGEKPLNKEQKIQELEKLKKSNDKQRLKKIRKLIYEKQRIEALLNHGIEKCTVCDYFGRRRVYISDFNNNLKEHFLNTFEDRIEIINSELKELGVEL